MGGFSSSFRGGQVAAHGFEGERLLQVEVNEKTGTTKFQFDLGAVLEVRRLQRFKRNDDLWLLYKPDGCVLSVRGDGTVSHQPGITGHSLQK